MCGITGKIYFDKSRKPDHTELKAMCDVIIHRGPDDEGLFISNNVGLGFRRLSIIDLNTGHQPLHNHDSSVVIVFNGEIYNYQVQRELLEKKGYIFKTATDTEVIVHLYEEYGVNCLQYLRGMFAFAIWDQKKGHLFCARDRFGIKPFYYFKDEQQFVFGSEIKSILKSGNIDTTLSEDALDSYFAFGYITSDLSIYKRIHKLLPGNYLLLTLNENSNLKTEKYWTINFDPDYTRSETYWKEELQACLSETVKLHMLSDVPLGAFLSGGIDSSSVVAMMAKNSTQPIKTFSIGFEDPRYSELKLARELAKKYNCDHYEQIVKPESIGLLPKLVKAYDEPFADSSAIPTYYVSKHAREKVTVALSGDGGDELFAGYSIYSVLHKIKANPLNFAYPLLNKLIWGTLHKIYPVSLKGKGYSYFLSKKQEELGAFIHIWSQDERKRLIQAPTYDNITFSASEQYKVEVLKLCNSDDFTTKLQALDIQTYMVDDILTKVDRVSMLNSLEVRVPILDHVFAELSFRIPPNLKLKGSSHKHILKDSMSEFLPHRILKSPKKGFSIPLDLWFKEDLKEYINDTLFSGSPLISEYLNINYVRKIIQTKNIFHRDFSARIWSLIFFEEWLRDRKT